MIYLQILLVLLVIYLLVEWVLPWLWYPRLRENKYPRRLPEDLEKKISEFNKLAKNDREFLKMVLDLMKTRFRFGHLTMFLYPKRWFETSTTKIWNDTQPQLCTIYNYLLGGILIKSGRFSPSQIHHKVVITNFSLHQYIEVDLKDGAKVVLDPWAHGMGKKFGESAFGFV